MNVFKIYNLRGNLGSVDVIAMRISNEILNLRKKEAELQQALDKARQEYQNLALEMIHAQTQSEECIAELRSQIRHMSDQLIQEQYSRKAVESKLGVALEELSEREYAM